MVIATGDPRRLFAGVARAARDYRTLAVRATRSLPTCIAHRSKAPSSIRVKRIALSYSNGLWTVCFIVFKTHPRRNPRPSALTALGNPGDKRNFGGNGPPRTPRQRSTLLVLQLPPNGHLLRFTDLRSERPEQGCPLFQAGASTRCEVDWEGAARQAARSDSSCKCRG